MMDLLKNTMQLECFVITARLADGPLLQAAHVWVSCHAGYTLCIVCLLDSLQHVVSLHCFLSFATAVLCFHPHVFFASSLLVAEQMCSRNDKRCPSCRVLDM
jgi:hypothetical protein